MEFFIPVIASALAAWAAYRLHALDGGGAFAATVVGSLVLAAGGWPWAELLLAFFVSSTLLTRLFRSRKQHLEDSSSRGRGRDASQVLANGALPAVASVMGALLPGSLWPWFLFASALAAVNADTWATELGALSLREPRLIIRPWVVVPRGTSGGVSLEGLAAAAAGAMLIAVLALWLWPGTADPSQAGWAAGWIGASGFAASIVDSVLGATLQAMYYCPTDSKMTEKHPLHTCGARTRLVRGWTWLDNNLVNFLAALSAVLLASASCLLIPELG